MTNTETLAPATCSDCRKPLIGIEDVDYFRVYDFATTTPYGEFWCADCA